MRFDNSTVGLKVIQTSQYRVRLPHAVPLNQVFAAPTDTSIVNHHTQSSWSDTSQPSPALLDDHIHIRCDRMACDNECTKVKNPRHVEYGDGVHA